MAIKVDKYLVKQALNYLNEHNQMMKTHLDGINDEKSEIYANVVKGIKTGNVEVPEEDVKKQIQQMSSNIMTSNINLNEIITDLEKAVNGEDDEKKEVEEEVEELETEVLN
jgi:hypothetical protein